MNTDPDNLPGLCRASATARLELNAPIWFASHPAKHRQYGSKTTHSSFVWRIDRPHRLYPPVPFGLLGIVPALGPRLRRQSLPGPERVPITIFSIARALPTHPHQLLPKPLSDRTTDATPLKECLRRQILISLRDGLALPTQHVKQTAGENIICFAQFSLLKALSCQTQHYPLARGKVENEGVDVPEYALPFLIPNQAWFCRKQLFVHW